LRGQAGPHRHGGEAIKEPTSGRLSEGDLAFRILLEVDEGLSWEEALAELRRLQALPRPEEEQSPPARIG
jgi:chlorite dismutase